jgi:methionine-rich copper-binding protein CopC
MQSLRTLSRLGYALVAVFLVALSAGAPAFAHAQLRSATPAAGGSVQTAPAEVVVNFSESLEGAFSTLVVRDAAGKRVDKADPHVDADNKTTMRVSLPPLEPGTYTVDWRAVSTDTHRVNGSFTFRIGQ